jgi:hypothetical protein
MQKYITLALFGLFVSGGIVFADDFIADGEADTGTATFTIGARSDTGDVRLQFGDTLAEYLQWDSIESRFSLSSSLSLEGNEIQDVRLENLAVAPVCDGTTRGKVYFNTSNNDTFSCNGTVWQSLTNSIVSNSVEQTTDYDALLVNTINQLSATSVNRPADKTFLVKTLGDASVKTQVATNGSERYFRTFENSAWTDWTANKTSVYQGYSVQDWDQTDGSASYIGRTRDTDSKWLITLSVPGGFTYAQIENNGGTADFATAWTNRLTLAFNSNFTP